MAFNNVQKNKGLTQKLKQVHQEKVINQFVEFHKKVSIIAFREVTATATFSGFAFGSPLWSGWFRASHNISINTPDFTQREPNPETRGKGATRWPDSVDAPLKSRTPAEAAAKLNGLRPFDTVYIANAAPHSRRIELDGWSAQVPAGVYNVTAENLKVRFARVKPGGF